MENIELNKVLSPGTLIRTKHPNSQWISSVAQNVYNNYIQINLTKDYVENLVLVGDEIKGKFFGSDVEYLFEGKIDSIDITNLSLLTICVEKINMFEDMRGYNRYDTHMISKVSISGNPPVYCIVTNVSSSGISLLTKCDFPLDIEAYIELFINSGKFLSFNGKIMRKSASESGFEHGIKISEIDKENIKIFKELLAHLKVKDNNLIQTYLSDTK